MIKNLPTNKNSKADGFIGKFYHTFREYPSLSNSSKKLKRKEHAQTCFTRLAFPIPKPDKNTTRKENYRPTSLMNIYVKTLNKIPTNLTQEHIKRITHHDQVGFIP